MAVIAGLGLAVSAVTAGVGAAQAAKAAKTAKEEEQKNRAEIEREKAQKEELFNLRYHQDMTDRTEVQSMLRQLREQQDAQRSQNEARAAVTGATKEQQIAEQDSLNKAYADSVAGIASNASLLKDGYLDQYSNDLSNYYNAVRGHNSTMAQIEMNKSNQWAQAADNAVGTLAGSAQSFAGNIEDAVAEGKALKAAKAPAATPAPKPDIPNTTVLNQDVINQDGRTATPIDPMYPIKKYFGKKGFYGSKDIVGYPIWRLGD